ncbi:MAG: acyltransferase family protein, partial [Paludibacteraceae bacterium]|nr:acyltransferase family protein [Paludibacteraceae bacterium]
MLIVFMHCDPPVFCESIVRLGTYREFNLLHGFLYESLFRLCVPIFFIISGYLFFINIDQFTKGVYCEKLHRRLHSLLIPYLVWNGVVFLLYYLGSMTIAPMPSGKAATSFSFSDFIWSFWNIGHVYGDDSFTGLVLDIPLWYVRDLMVISLLSPLLYLLLTKTKGFILLVFAVLWAGELIPDFYAPSDQALFFFSFGAYAGIRKFVIPVEWGDKRCFLFLLIYLLLAVPILYFRFFRSFEVFWVWIKHVNDLFGIATILLLALRLT